MSDNPLSGLTLKSEHAFPMVIAITALILSIASGIVNYRQNNLTNLESSLRDTRDQLQLAKNDISEIKLNTIKQLVDAELAIKNQHHIKRANTRLSEELTDANARVRELENQIRRMDSKLVRTSASLKAAKKKAVRKVKAKKTAAKKATANLATLIAATDLDIYTQKIAPSLQKNIGAAINKHGFHAEFPALPDAMSLANSTTVFYYDASYKAVAEKLAKELTAITKGKVALRKGASPYDKNKIITHIIAN